MRKQSFLPKMFTARILHWTALALFVWAIVLNIFLLPRLDVDTYHDGFIYPMAFFASDGGIPNRDFFSLYGPLAPLIQGQWIDIFGAKLFNLRLHGAFIIILIACLLHWHLRRWVKWEISAFLTLIWLIGNPLIVHPSLPWVDLYTTLIWLSVLFLIMKIPSKLKSSHFFLIGFCLAIGVMAKINFLLPISVFFLILLVTFGMRQSLFYSLGVLSLLTICVLIMYLSESLTRYVEQGVIFAFVQHDKGKSIRGIFNIKIAIFGILVLVFILMLQKLNSKIRKVKKIENVLALLVSITFALVAFYFRDVEKPFTAFSGNLLDDLRNALKNSPYALMFAVIFGAVSSMVITFYKRQTVKLLDTHILTSGAGFASIFQLYPNPEPGHIWYVFPVTAVGVIPWLAYFLNEETIKRVAKFLLVPTCAALTVINILYLSIERKPHSEDPLIGMLSRPNKVTKIDDSLKRLKSYNLNQGLTIQFNCPRGIYSLAGNSYNGSDYQYVDIIPPFYLAKSASKYIFECDVSKEEEALIRKKYQIVFSVESELTLLKNVFYYLE